MGPTRVREPWARTAGKKVGNGEKTGRGEDKKRTHREGSHPQARKNAFPRTRPYWHPDF